MQIMKNRFLNIWTVMLLLVSCNANNNMNTASAANAVNGKTMYDFTMKDIDGKDVPLSNYKGKIVVIVNTASQCGLVGQLSEIEAFYKNIRIKA